MDTVNSVMAPGISVSLSESEFGDGESYCFIKRVGAHIHYMRYSVRAGE